MVRFECRHALDRHRNERHRRDRRHGGHAYKVFRPRRRTRRRQRPLDCPASCGFAVKQSISPGSGQRRRQPVGRDWAQHSGRWVIFRTSYPKCPILTHPRRTESVRKTDKRGLHWSDFNWLTTVQLLLRCGAAPNGLAAIRTRRPTPQDRIKRHQPDPGSELRAVPSDLAASA